MRTNRWLVVIALRTIALAIAFFAVHWTLGGGRVMRRLQSSSPARPARDGDADPSAPSPWKTGARRQT
jgi:hypothetical protein